MKALPSIVVLVLSLAAFNWAAAASEESIAASVEYDWPSYAHDQGASKYADLDQINAETVGNLRTVWTWDSPDNEFLEANTEYSSSGFRSTPIKIGELLYVSTPMGHVAAIDAVTGKQRWVFDSKTYEHGRPANIGFNHRGVAYWEAGTKRRILIGTNNAYLWSLDAATGLPDKSFGEGGKVDLTVGLGREVDRSKYSNVAAVTVIGDTVVMGSVVSDMPLIGWFPEKRSDLPPGHIRGFDVNSGEQKWRFNSIPQPGEVGNETWENDSWKVTGAANVWTNMSADPELGYVYLPFGSPANDWYGGQRLGDNLFGNSLVCVDASTGEMVWHFQMIHHDLWDYDLPAAPILADIKVDGKKIKAVAQVSKQGFVYVLDRITGKPVWPIEERPVPQSTVPGERAAATQPFPTRPAPFEVQGLTEDGLIDFTPELRAEAVAMISQYRNDGFFTPPSMEGSIQLPGDGGGAEWNSAAFDPQTSMLYVSSVTSPIVSRLFEPEPGTTEFRYMRGGNRNLRGPKRLPLTKPPYGRISAIDLTTGDYAWVVPNGDGIRQRIIDMGIPDPGPVGSGHASPLLTKSLIFIPAFDGGRPLLRALDKATGKTLHETELPVRPTGPAITYMVNGKQYISMAAMAGSKDAKLITLSLP